jgi:Arc/MetJ-type ribon-helix-helix transcriptional regulator
MTVFTVAVRDFTMPRLTITLEEEQAALIDEKTGDGGEYESKSEAVRELIRRGERVEEEVADLEETIADLERQVERLQNEKATLLRNREEHTELVRYVEEERSYRSAGIVTRAKWWLLGMSDETVEA